MRLRGAPVVVLGCEDREAAVVLRQPDGFAARDDPQPADDVRACRLARDELEPRERAGVLDDLRARADIAPDELEQPAVVGAEQLRLVAFRDGRMDGTRCRAHAGLLW